ncbi:MAG: hypothetical protein BJ554DRAFT_4422, partial [Olpidium bornovanus]
PDFALAAARDVGLQVTGGFFSVVLLALDVVAVAEVLQSDRRFLEKFLWTLGIFVFPFLGLLA